jgi:hypothetical protein
MPQERRTVMRIVGKRTIKGRLAQNSPREVKRDSILVSKEWPKDVRNETFLIGTVTASSCCGSGLTAGFKQRILESIQSKIISDNNLAK